MQYCKIAQKVRSISVEIRRQIFLLLCTFSYFLPLLFFEILNFEDCHFLFLKLSSSTLELMGAAFCCIRQQGEIHPGKDRWVLDYD